MVDTVDEGEAAAWAASSAVAVGPAGAAADAPEASPDLVGAPEKSPGQPPPGRRSPHGRPGRGWRRRGGRARVRAAPFIRTVDIPGLRPSLEGVYPNPAPSPSLDPALLATLLAYRC